MYFFDLIHVILYLLTGVQKLYRYCGSNVELNYLYMQIKSQWGSSVHVLIRVLTIAVGGIQGRDRPWDTGGHKSLTLPGFGFLAR